MKDKPYYNGSSINKISSLAKLLEVNEAKLIHCARNVDSSYYEFNLSREGKKDRLVVDAKPALKNIQKLINSRIMKNVEFPIYLMGGIKDDLEKRDYINNSKLHLRKETLVNLDIESFFPSITREYVHSIFKHLFKFGDEVSELLTELTTYKGAVPQGAPTSTYIANLIFHNSEYRLVSRFRKKGIVYSRLLDDITLSSDRVLESKEIEESIKKVVGMFKSYDLKLHQGKTKVEHRENNLSSYRVTGAWVRYGEPKITKKDRANIRSSVKECERNYHISPFESNYHRMWYQASGRVAQLKRFNHMREEKALRKRLSSILPLYDQEQANTIEYKVKNLISRKEENKLDLTSLKTRQQIDKIIHDLGIISRNDRARASRLRALVKENFKFCVVTHE